MRPLRILVAAAVALAVPFTALPARAEATVVAPCSLTHETAARESRDATLSGGPVVTNNPGASVQLLCAVQRNSGVYGQNIVKVYSPQPACVASPCSGDYVFCVDAHCSGYGTFCILSDCDDGGGWCVVADCRDDVPGASRLRPSYIPPTAISYAAYQPDTFFVCTVLRWRTADATYDEPRGCAAATS